MKAVASGVVGFILLLACGLVAVMVGVGGGTPTATAIGTCATDANLAPILTTIRTIETGGNYATTITTSTASGAYAFLDGTWHAYGGYARAADAPPDLQDQKATELVRTILTANDQAVSAIPVAWYIGHVPAPDSSEWDTIPAPDAGNRLTPREYQTKWMAEYDRQQTAAGGPTAAMSCTAPAPFVATGSTPDHLDCGPPRFVATVSDPSSGAARSRSADGEDQVTVLDSRSVERPVGCVRRLRSSAPDVLVELVEGAFGASPCGAEFGEDPLDVDALDQQVATGVDEPFDLTFGEVVRHRQ